MNVTRKWILDVGYIKDEEQRRPKAENVKTSLLCYQGPTKVNKQYTYVVLLIVDKQYTYCCSVDKRYCRQYSWYRQYSQQTIYIVLLSWQYLIFANLAIWLHLLPPNVKGKRYWTLSFPFLAKERLIAMPMIFRGCRRKQDDPNAPTSLFFFKKKKGEAKQWVCYNIYSMRSSCVILKCEKHLNCLEGESAEAKRRWTVEIGSHQGGLAQCWRPPPVLLWGSCH